MPVRIYDIAKKLGIESKVVMIRAKELGIAGARVASSTLDKITAEYLEDEIRAQLKLLQPTEPVVPVAPPEPIPEVATSVAPTQEAPVAAITSDNAASAAAIGTIHPVQPVAPVTAIEPDKVTQPPQTPIAVPTAVPQVTIESLVLTAAPIIEAVEPKLEAAPPVLAPLPSSELPPPAHGAVIETAGEAAAATTPSVISIAEPKVETAERIGTSEDATSAEVPSLQAVPPSPPPTPPTPVTPPVPPRPQIGDKVGFIQLPPKPSPKMGDKVGSVQLPAKPVAKGEQPRGKVDGKPPTSAFQARSKSPLMGRSFVSSQIKGGVMPSKPTAPAPTKFVPPASGDLLTMKPPVVVRSLAEMLKRKPFQLIADLMELGVFANVNQTIEESVAQRLCAKYGFRFQVEKRDLGAHPVHAPVRKPDTDPEDKVEDLKPRPPVVTIMGHVDHGKTTLLDVIRKSDVAAGEAGGITQHIGAYTISFPHPERPADIQQITFLDTPGHAAFSAMRARGANVTDIVILVVAANDGVMPQTVEAINHAVAARVPIMVAVNKCDHPNANQLRVRQQLQEKGLVCEEWGGNVIFQDLSALTKKGVDKLLELVLLQAEMMELKANPNRAAKGNVIESGLEPGGPTATVLVRKGTLKLGDIVLCGPFWGKTRALINEEGNRLKSAGPSVAVKLLGLNGVPEAGLEFAVVGNERSARDIGEQRAQSARERGVEDRQKVTLENLFKTLSADERSLRLVVKGDTQGSVEAICEALKKIESTKVSLEIIHSAVGIITESDVVLASASKAIIIGFHTRVDPGSAEAAKREGVQIKLYSIIYELIDQVKDAMAGLLEPILKETVLGQAEVRQVFGLSKGGTVAGCIVSSGRITRGRCRVLRRKDVIYEGNISSLRRFQDEATEVRSGLECGIRVDGFAEFQVSDSIECYQVDKIAQKL